MYVAPGTAYHSPVAGYFRLTFTLRREFLEVGLDRMERFLKQVQVELKASA